MDIGGGWTPKAFFGVKTPILHFFKHKKIIKVCYILRKKSMELSAALSPSLVVPLEYIHSFIPTIPKKRLPQRGSKITPSKDKLCD